MNSFALPPRSAPNQAPPADSKQEFNNFTPSYLEPKTKRFFFVLVHNGLITIPNLDSTEFCEIQWSRTGIKIYGEGSGGPGNCCFYVILRLLRSRRGDGGRARDANSDTTQRWPELPLWRSPAPQFLLWEPLPRSAPLGSADPSPFPQVPGNKGAGQGKGLAATDEKKKTRFQRKDARLEAIGRGWRGRALAGKDQGAQLRFDHELGAEPQAVRVAREFSFAGVFPSWPWAAGPPRARVREGDSFGRRGPGGGLRRRKVPRAEATSLHAGTVCSRKRKGRGGCLRGS